MYRARMLTLSGRSPQSSAADIAADSPALIQSGEDVAPSMHAACAFIVSWDAQAAMAPGLGFAIDSATAAGARRALGSSLPGYTSSTAAVCALTPDSNDPIPANVAHLYTPHSIMAYLIYWHAGRAWILATPTAGSTTLPGQLAQRSVWQRDTAPAFVGARKRTGHVLSCACAHARHEAAASHGVLPLAVHC